MRALSITACAFAAHALLIPSCVQWNIGKSIRECAETRVGVNPADAWYVGEAKPMQDNPFPAPPGETRQIGLLADGRVWVAREAEYEADTPLVTIDWVADFSGTTPSRAQKIMLTDAYRRVSFAYNKFGGMSTTVGGRYATEGQNMERYHSMKTSRSTLNARTMGSAAVKRSPWYPLAVVAAAPFDYIIDPALTVISTPVGALVQATILGCHEVKRALREEKAAEATPPSAPTPTPTEP